ncbi:MAG TPA: hypothetical protein VGC42_14715 [Kofleriaceae bacterium]
MGKRSPILGYNHNVRYRGLVFHVQTEDSGLASPHLFTHLFHEGVIISSRKLVYDAGSAEESIKSLMQAQHKATLKDLRRGHFDDKIDSYLGGTPGLLPRGQVEPEAEVVAAEPVIATGVVEDVAIGAPTEQALPMMDLSEPVMITERPQTRPLIPPPPLPRSVTERALAQALGRGTPPSVDTTMKTELPVFAEDATQAVPQRAERIDSSELDAPEIEIQLEVEAEEPGLERTQQEIPRRHTRDTELNATFDETRPTIDVDDHTRPTLGMINEEARRALISDGIPALRAAGPAIPPPPPTDRKLGDRPSTINASALPPARPINRPASRPALSQPQVLARPITSDDRSRRESEAVEVYSPPPASAELPGERPGQYAQHKKVSTRIPIEGLKNERSGGVAIPAGLGRPHRPQSAPPSNRPGSAPAAHAPAPAHAPSPAPAHAPSPAHAASHDAHRLNAHSEPVRARRHAAAGRPPDAHDRAPPRHAPGGQRRGDDPPGGHRRRAALGHAARRHRAADPQGPRRRGPRLRPGPDLREEPRRGDPGLSVRRCRRKVAEPARRGRLCAWQPRSRCTPASGAATAARPSACSRARASPSRTSTAPGTTRSASGSPSSPAAPPSRRSSSTACRSAASTT